MVLEDTFYPACVNGFYYVLTVIIAPLSALNHAHNTPTLSLLYSPVTIIASYSRLSFNSVQMGDEEDTTVITGVCRNNRTVERTCVSTYTE